jgi:hypothetical protein
MSHSMNLYYGNTADIAEIENIFAAMHESDGVAYLGSPYSSDEWDNGDQWLGLCATVYQTHIGPQSDNTDGTDEGCTNAIDRKIEHEMGEKVQS